MSNIFIISDTHFGHQGMCDFIREDGNKVRPFLTYNQCDDVMIENWNKTVRPNDKVYHLGDVAIKRQHIQTIEKLNGKKILIRGNHDIFKLNDYAKFFKDIRGTHKLDFFLLSHYPVHPDSISGSIKCNLHGHIHYRTILDENKNPDKKYINCSVEVIDYTPIPLDKAIKIFNS
jgi:calcineurin-like phosphoesterase family protein